MIRTRLGSILLVFTALISGGCGNGNEPQRSNSSSPSSTPTAGYSLSGTKARPDFMGPGAAGACADDDDEVVHVSLELDVPSPRCVIVRGSQRLSVTNKFVQPVTASLGGAEIHLPGGSTVTLAESFSDYLEPGGYYMTLQGASTYSVEIRYEGTS